MRIGNVYEFVTLLKILILAELNYVGTTDTSPNKIITDTDTQIDRYTDT